MIFSIFLFFLSFAACFDEQFRRCRALPDANESSCTALEHCSWVLEKSGGYCTKKFVIAPLADDEAHSIVDEQDIRAWGKRNCAQYGWQPRQGRLPRIYDTFIFYNELELMDIRLNELADVVDWFVVVEADHTFTFKPKPLYFQQRIDEFDTFAEQLVPFECKLAENAPGNDEYKRGWNREHAQRACIHDALAGIGDGGAPRPDDIVLLSDADELPRREPLMALKACAVDADELAGGITLVQPQHAYTFYYQLTERSEWPGYAQWPGTVAITAEQFEEKKAGGVRFKRADKSLRRIFDAGWHFSPFPFGDADRVVDKLKSWAHQEKRRQTEQYRDPARWKKAIETGSNCRRLDTWQEYMKLPLYVRDNRHLYEDMLLPLEELKGKEKEDL